MPEVITWTVAGGSLVFAVGLISALEARRQSKFRPREKIVVQRIVEGSPKDIPTETSMAAGGVANGEETLASFGSSTR